MMVLVVVMIFDGVANANEAIKRGKGAVALYFDAKDSTMSKAGRDRCKYQRETKRIQCRWHFGSWRQNGDVSIISFVLTNTRARGRQAKNVNC